MILSSRKYYKAAILWDNLTEDQEQKVLTSEREICNESAWESHEEMKRKNAKWLN